MKKLNKRYEKSMNSVRAQITCPCSANACRGCNSMDIKTNLESLRTMQRQHEANQYKLYT